MVDVVEAKKNLDIYNANKQRLESYNHLNSTYQFKQVCGAELRKLNLLIANLESMLNAESQKTGSNQKAAMHPVR